MVTFHRTPADHVGAVRRAVCDDEREGLAVRVMVAERTYEASVEEVWAALTTPARIPRWLGPVSGDLRLGGRFQVEGNAGGEVLACEAPTHLALTWESQGQVSWVDVHLDDVPTGTTLRLEHAADVPPDFWDAYGPGAVGLGWELVLLGLDQHLVDPGFHAADVQPVMEAPQEHPEEMAWLGAVMSGSNDGWERASTAYGTDPAAAAAAAARTLAFYTGAEAPTD